MYLGIFQPNVFDSNQFTHGTNRKKDSSVGLAISYWSQKDMGVAWSGGCHAYLPQKTLKKKVNLTEQSQDAKKIFFDLIFNILML